MNLKAQGEASQEQVEWSVFTRVRVESRLHILKIALN